MDTGSAVPLSPRCVDTEVQEARIGQQMGRAWAWPRLWVHGAMAVAAAGTGAGLRAARVQHVCLHRASLT